MTNPLLDQNGLPPFSRIKPEHVKPAIETLLSESRQLVEHCCSSTASTAGIILSSRWMPWMTASIAPGRRSAI